MPINFSCRRCGATLAVKEEFAGRSIACRECGGSVTVPSGRAAAPARPRAQQRAASRKPSGSGKGLLFGLVGGGALLVAVCAGAGFYVYRWATVRVPNAEDAILFGPEAASDGNGGGAFGDAFSAVESAIAPA